MMRIHRLHTYFVQALIANYVIHRFIDMNIDRGYYYYYCDNVIQAVYLNTYEIIHRGHTHARARTYYTHCCPCLLPNFTLLFRIFMFERRRNNEHSQTRGGGSIKRVYYTVIIIIQRIPVRNYTIRNSVLKAVVT